MKQKGLYLTEPGKVKERIEKAGLAELFSRKIIKS